MSNHHTSILIRDGVLDWSNFLGGDLIGRGGFPLSSVDSWWADIDDPEITVRLHSGREFAFRFPFGDYGEAWEAFTRVFSGALRGDSPGDYGKYGASLGLSPSFLVSSVPDND